MRHHFLPPILALALLVAWLSPAPVDVQAVPGRSDFGVNTHIASRYPVQAGFDGAVDLVAGTSAGWVREDFHWYWLEPEQGRFDWAIYDRAIARLAGSGVNIIGVLNTAPAWATPFPDDAPGRPSYYAPDPAAFARFASAVVTRYRDRVRFWQVWNEPENVRYWQPQPDPAAYAALLRAAYPAIKSADPNAVVLSAGVVPTNIGFIRAIADNGAWGSFDILAVHPYVDPFSPENGQIGAGDVSAVKTLVDNLGRKPIWATEFGWSTGPADRDPRGVDEETQANFLVRASTLLRAAGVEKVIWYNLKDTEPRNLYGLLRRAGGPADLSQPKPSLAAFRTLNQQLAGAAPVGLIDLGARQVVVDFEQFGTWRRGDQPNGSFSADGSQRYTGNIAGRLDYIFPGGGNDFVVFTPRPAIPLPGSPGQLGIWVYGDGSGHALKVWLRDAEGETLQFRLGFVGSAGWSFLSTTINGQVEPYNRISGGGNLRLDFPATLVAIVLDDEPDSRSGSGSIWLDDLTAISGPEAYGVRFVRGGDTIDALWSPGGAFVNLPTAAPVGTVIDRWGNASQIDAGNGAFGLSLGPSPIFLIHRAVQAFAPQPAPAPAPAQPAPQPSAGPCRSFPETGFAVCGRLLEYWERNGGLPVFGFPIGPEEDMLIEGKTVRAQWFERNRLELHPQNAPPYDVLLGRLGAERLEASGRNWFDFPKGDPRASLYFPQTGQAIAPEFRQYWSSHGLNLDGRPGYTLEESLALFGLPLSPPLMEVNPTDGKTYLTQHFERARFEYHPENRGTPYVVLLGLLGRETTGKR
ncbi:beta-galactosidase [Roseiflexus castenholzii]|jgi:hypothetical protein|uniref:Asl1-like glycosyl hydrolase catalytic domain-containing protein n=1 Tax=Roseiflexus castenholzii (strain DSM 13941 / HLO8) TaxID=383372 RepID=A7NNF7_ROSCS|nr:beta-galactosidase [Roseiflexus castenholzii]ABU59093.1 conserved hypothetical protein [Roseiflexus castenholzii DSM 13941]